MNDRSARRNSSTLVSTHSSPSVRRSSSQYHQKCLSGVKEKTGNVSPKPMGM